MRRVQDNLERDRRLDLKKTHVKVFLTKGKLERLKGFKSKKGKPLKQASSFPKREKFSFHLNRKKRLGVLLWEKFLNFILVIGQSPTFFRHEAYGLLMARQCLHKLRHQLPNSYPFSSFCGVDSSQICPPRLLYPDNKAVAEYMERLHVGHHREPPKSGLLLCSSLSAGLTSSIGFFFGDFNFNSRTQLCHSFFSCNSYFLFYEWIH